MGLQTLGSTGFDKYIPFTNTQDGVMEFGGGIRTNQIEHTLGDNDGQNGITISTTGELLKGIVNFDSTTPNCGQIRVYGGCLQIYNGSVWDTVQTQSITIPGSGSSSTTYTLLYV